MGPVFRPRPVIARALRRAADRIHPAQPSVSEGITTIGIKVTGNSVTCRSRPQLQRR